MLKKHAIREIRTDAQNYSRTDALVIIGKPGFIFVTPTSSNNHCCDYHTQNNFYVVAFSS